MKSLKHLKISFSKTVIWIRELRAPFFTATIVPVLLGSIMAWCGVGVLNVTRFVLTLIAALCLHAGTNMINDYFDYKSGCDLHPMYQEFCAPFFGGSRMLPSGQLKPQEVYAASLLSFGFAIILGVFLAIQTGWILILIGLLGVLSGYLYTRYLATRGVGEFFVGLNFGPLVVMGSYYVQTRTLTAEPIIASIPVGLLIAAVLWINEIPDYIADQTVGKNTLVVRLGRKRASDVYALLMIITYVFIVLAAGLRLMPTYSLIALVTLPLSLKAIKIARQHHEEPYKMVSANALTILIHFFTGLLLALGYLLNFWISHCPRNFSI